MGMTPRPDTTLARATIVDGLAEPARDTDRRVLQVVELMINHSWSPEREEELAKEWGVSVGTMHAHADEAGRFIRLCQDPDKVRQWGMTKLNRLVEDPATPPHAKVAAVKVALDATMEPKRGPLAAPAALPRADKLARLRSDLLGHGELYGAIRELCAGDAEVRRVVGEMVKGGGDG